MMLCGLFAVSLLFSVAQGSWQRNTIIIQDGGYENVLIAINKDVAEDQAIIDNLIDIFTIGSGHLFTATRRRAYWRNITILIPNTWTAKPEYEPARTESFETANIIVDSPNPEWEDNPYTLQLRGCGVSGEYIHLTPTYLTDRANSEYIWGPMGKLLTHEWGHLRWGLFDEYDTSEDGVQPFYANSRGQIEATRCTTEIEGEALNINTFRSCQRDPDTGLYEEDCFYFPNLKGQTARASIMYAQFLDSVIEYCHSEPGVPGYHNEEAPHRHNKLCASRSSWDIMMETKDFINGNNPPFEGSIDTTPTFRLVQARDRRVVLVLDVSGSMGTNDRLQKLYQAATQYLRYTIDDGSFVGIVEFSEYSDILTELVEIVNETSREYLVSKLPTTPNGWTCIGCGIQDGIRVLSGPSRTYNPAGGYILLISDGDENKEPYIADVYDDVDEAGVIIDTIAFSEAADPQLLELSRRTNGLAFFYPDTDNSTALNDAFTATVTSRPGLSSEMLPIQIYSGALLIPADAPVTESFLIDSTLGIDTVLMFSWLDDPIAVEVVDPDGNRINSSDTTQYRKDETAMIVTVVIIEKAKPGSWTFTISNDANNEGTVIVTVESKPSSETDLPITVNAIVGSQVVNHTVTPALEIFAEVRKGYLPVINAGVQAVIERPGADPTYLPLHDNGAGADITKHDGVYSAYFLDFSAGGRYSVKVQVSNEGQTASISRSKRSSRGLPLSPDRYVPTPLTYEPAEPFHRTSAGGVFEVQDYEPPVGDQLAPSRINDLSVLASTYENSSVTLQWTAVGDDLDQGTAFKYDLRYASTFSTVKDNFTSCIPVLDNDILSGIFSAVGESGTVETVIITVPSRGENVAYFFAITAMDEDGNTGALSNIVSASLEYIPPISNPKTGPEPWVIGVSVAAAALVILLVIVVTVLFCKNTSKKADIHSDHNGKNNGKAV